jgi:hypothetical protein
MQLDLHVEVVRGLEALSPLHQFGAGALHQIAVTEQGTPRGFASPRRGNLEASFMVGCGIELLQAVNDRLPGTRARGDQTAGDDDGEGACRPNAA